MKLVQKLTLAFITGTSIILAGNGYRRVHREVDFFERSRARDHRLIGQALGAAVSAVWRTDGEERARALVEEASAHEDRVHIRWAPLAPAPGEKPPTVGALAAAALSPGQSITGIVQNGDADPVRYTYVPLSGPPRPGVLELSESMAPERAYIRATIVDTALTAIFLAGMSALLSSVLGVWFVGRPVDTLIAKARRVGLGDFSAPLDLRRKDELAELAREMNSMCEQLVALHERVASETAARIATFEQLRHADRLATVGKLASGIAHELGTPLNVVSARAGMIAAGEATPDEAQAYAQVVVDATERMAKIIRQLLDFARRKGVQRAEHDLIATSERTIELLQPLAANRGVTLAVVGEREALRVDADASQIQQVITNLVVNAIQATPAGRRVELWVERKRARAPVDLGGFERDCIRIVIRDEGEGISEENLVRVFEPFFTTKNVGEGTGLGLAVAYGIVRDHGGWIDGRSEMGQGSEFSVYLPA